MTARLVNHSKGGKNFTVLNSMLVNKKSIEVGQLFSLGTASNIPEKAFTIPTRRSKIVSRATGRYAATRFETSFEADLYTKPTDKHQHLLHSSCHPLHTKRAIPFSLALRLRRICSSDESFTLRANKLIKYLNDRGYNLSFYRAVVGVRGHVLPSVY